MKIDRPISDAERPMLRSLFLANTSGLLMIAVRAFEGEERTEVLRDLLTITNRIAGKFGELRTESPEELLASLSKAFDLDLPDSVLDDSEITEKETQL
ncbi:MAG TPA: hypothetical protein VHQ01_03295 [Pyrinomonadaceae bacterium]|nr:hypothetical protein [Pyrinomonadaceae bacterium]